MKEWILSIASVLLLTSAISMILPSGKTGKVIKPIFTILLMLVIIKPLIKINDLELNFDRYLQNNFEIQTNYIEFVDSKRIQNNKDNIELIIKKIGVESPKIDLIIDKKEGNSIIVGVIIDIKKSVINLNGAHINISEEITNKVSTYLSIDKKDVVVYE